MDYTLSFGKKIGSGTNCEVYRFRFGNFFDMVVKKYRVYNLHLARKVFKVNVEIREILEKRNVNVPHVYLICPFFGGLIVEKFVGVSIRDYARNRNLNPEILKECKKIIMRLPQNIPLDTNPGNFVVNDVRHIYFVDFMPPNPWMFIRNKNRRDLFEKFFPQTRLVETDPDMKDRYLKNPKRLQKFEYYLQKFWQV